MTGPERFFAKTANLASIFPMVAAPAVGGYAGRAIGARYPGIGPELGALIGGVSGGVGGQLIRERVENNNVPPGAPYALDPTSADIPPWALQGAQMLQPVLKQSSAMDWVLGEIPGGNVAQRGVTGGPGQAARAFAGSALGGVPGALLGLGVGKGIEHFTGPINVPGLRIPLHELLAGLGGTVGATKGLQHFAPESGH
jgi:outer membrane lipoprotein SlyB